jgi:hypothetical protein
MCGGNIGIGGNDAAKHGLGPRQFAALEQDHAEQMHRVEIRGLAKQNCTVDRLGFAELAALMGVHGAP